MSSNGRFWLLKPNRFTISQAVLLMVLVEVGLAVLVPVEALGSKIGGAEGLVALALFLSVPVVLGLAQVFAKYGLEQERIRESRLRGGRAVLGVPPDRAAFKRALRASRAAGRKTLGQYLVGFELGNGNPLWLSDQQICEHACVFAKTGVGKTLWLESIMFQQMARGRASGCTFIDAKRDSDTLSHVVLMAALTGRLEDLIVVDPFEPAHSYNFVLTNQRADVKARKVLRAGLPPTTDQSVIKHYDRLATDSIYRMVRSLESLGFTWSIKDVGSALSSFNVAYPKLRRMLKLMGERDALVELSHLASSYRNNRGALDTARFTENVRGIAAELNAIAGSAMGEVFCAKSTDLVLTDAILRGKIIYFMLPRLEEAESASRMVKLFREDLEVSIGEITSSRALSLEDPHLVFIDEGSSTFGPTWANLFELARKGKFGLLFGAQSTGSLTDSSLGLSQAFYERVMANVSLKVMMRLGDHRTATEMAQWLGGADGESEAQVRGDLGFDGADELKHDMHAEKGLSWFDMGDGRIKKGRCFWFDAEIPANWNGRPYLTRYDQHANDDIGLASWVDEEVLTRENARSGAKGGARQAGVKSPPSGKFAPQSKGSGVNEEQLAGKRAPAGAKTAGTKGTGSGGEASQVGGADADGLDASQRMGAARGVKDGREIKGSRRGGVRRDVFRIGK